MFQLTITDKKKPKRTFIRVSLGQLARETGFSKSHLSRVFQGKSGFSPRLLSEVAEAVGLPMDVVYDFIKRGKIHVRPLKKSGRK